MVWVIACSWKGYIGLQRYIIKEVTAFEHNIVKNKVIRHKGIKVL